MSNRIWFGFSLSYLVYNLGISILERKPSRPVSIKNLSSHCCCCCRGWNWRDFVLATLDVAGILALAAYIVRSLASWFNNFSWTSARDGEISHHSSWSTIVLYSSGRPPNTNSIWSSCSIGFLSKASWSNRVVGPCIYESIVLVSLVHKFSCNLSCLTWLRVDLV